MSADKRLNLRPDVTLCHADVVIVLQIELDFRRYAEILAKSQCSIGSDRALAVFNFTNAIGWHTYILDNSLMLTPMGFMNSSSENFAGRNRIE